MRRAQAYLYTRDPRDESQIKRLLLIYRLPETIPYSSTSYYAISLGNYIHILDNGVAKGALVGRGYILS
jgi:hypothetical protein